MIKCVAQRLFDEIDTVLERQQANVDLSNVIEHWFAGITVQNAEGWLVWIQLLVHAQRESAFADLFRERYARFRKSFISTLLAGQEQGTIRSDVAADILADQISAFSDGWMAMTSLRKDGVSSDYHKTLVDALMTIIAPTQRTNPIQEAALAERHAPYDKS